MKSLHANKPDTGPSHISFLFFPFLPSFQMSDDNNDPSFYSISQPHPSDETIRDNYVQLAQIQSWNGQHIFAFWHENQNEVAFEIGDEWIVQPDDAVIVDSLARLFACQPHQIRFNSLKYVDVMNGDREVASIDDTYLLYGDDWRTYARDNTALDFNVEIDVEADAFPSAPAEDEAEARVLA